MLRRAITWLRVVAPPPSVCGFVLFVYAIGALAIGSARWYVGAAMPEVEAEVFMLSVVAGVAYAVYRGQNFHPIFQDDYLKWLLTTPWQAGKPLPKGPIHLVPQDLVIWGLLCLPLAWHETNIRSIKPITVLAELTISKKLLLCGTLSLFGYLLPTAIALRVAGRMFLTYVLAFACVTAAWFILSPGWNFALAAACYAIGWFAVSRSLEDYPWADRTEAKNLRFEFSLLRAKLSSSGKSTRTQRPASLGWPLHVAIEQPASPQIRYWEGFAVSLLIGWAAYVVLSWISHPFSHQPDSLSLLVRAEMADGFSIMLVFIVVIVSLIRLAMYIEGTRPPLSILGRVIRGRWIMPKYDQIFLAPLAIVLFWGLAIALLHNTYLNINAVATATLGLIVFIALNCPPSLRAWRLTGQFRSAPSLTIKKDSVEA